MVRAQGQIHRKGLFIFNLNAYYFGAAMECAIQLGCLGPFKMLRNCIFQAIMKTKIRLKYIKDHTPCRGSKIIKKAS